MTLAPRIYVAPTEPPTLRTLGKVTLLPETFGCDILYYSYSRPATVIGFQRKEIKDFIASITDGRLTKELGQITDNTHLTYTILIIEGRLVWTTDGNLANSNYGTITKSTYRKLLAYIQTLNIQILTTDSVEDTKSVIVEIGEYLSRPNHTSLLRRPKTSTKNSWGRATSAAFASHLLQSFPNIGPTTAKDIYTAFGRIPLTWTCNEVELTRIPGIGKKMARRLMEALE